MEYTALSIMIGVLFVLVCAAVNWQTGICYLVGAITNALCGYGQKQNIKHRHIARRRGRLNDAS